MSGRGGPGPVGDALRVLTLRVGDQWYGVPLEAVERVLDGARASAADEASPTVIDLAERIGAGGAGGAPRRHVLVIRGGGGRTAAVRVEEVQDVRTVPRGLVVAVPRYFDRARPWLLGVARLDERLLVLLNADGLVAAAEDHGEAPRGT